MAYEEEFRYTAEKFSTYGFGDGYPVRIELKKPDAVWGIEEGTAQVNLRKETSINQFWNLAAIETSFVIQTEQIPAGYTTGYAYNSNSSTPATGQIVTSDWEAINTYDSGSYPPHYRMFKEKTGEFEVQTINTNNLIKGSGSQHMSCFASSQDYFIPLNIQPKNTGAFIITLDSGVADYFSSQSSFSSQINKFELNMLFDMGINFSDEIGGEFNNIEYFSFTRTGYLVPADGWNFSIKGSKVKGIYYNYEYKKPHRDTPKRNISFIPPKGVNPKFIDNRSNDNILLDEPISGNGSTYSASSQDPKTQVCDLGGAAIQHHSPFERFDRDRSKSKTNKRKIDPRYVLDKVTENHYTSAAISKDCPECS